MKTSLGKLVIVLLSLSLALGFICFAQQTLTVPDDYPTIQAAIDAAQPGDTVYIRAGRYRENLVIEKPLQLVGEDRTQVIIQSANPEEDVVEVRLERGEALVEGIAVTGGEVGFRISVESSAVGTLRGVTAISNRYGIATMGEGEAAIVDSFLIDNEKIGLLLGNAKSHVRGSEILEGGMGVLLVGGIEAELSENLVGLCQWGIDTYTTQCGWTEGTESFPGTVSGQENRVYGLDTHLCPSYPGEPWPQGFIDLAWTETIEKAVESSNRGDERYRSQDFQGAQIAYEAGLAIIKQAPFPFLQAQLSNNIGVVYSDLGRYEEALDKYQAARAVYVDRGMEVNVAGIDHNIGNVYANLRQYEDALVSYQSARAIYVDRGMEVDIAEIDHNIGNVYKDLGRYEEALDKYQAARAVYVDRGMEVDIAEIDQNIGLVYRHLGRYEEVLDAYEQARAIYVDRRMEVNVAGIDQNIGVVYDDLGRYEEALVSYQSARAIYVDRGMEVDIAGIDQNIGNVHVNLGRYEEALDAYEQARAIYVDRGMEVDIAEIDHNIGVVYDDLGRYEEALAAYRSTLEILNLIPPVPGMAYSYPATRWMLYTNMGIAHEALNEWKEARQSYENAIDVIESLRSHLKSEELKSAWQERTQHVYERLIDLLYRRGQGAFAFTYAERCRARTFLDLLAKGPVATLENVAEEGIRSGVVEPSAIEADVDEVARSLPSNTAALECFVTDNATYVWVIYQGEIQGPIQLEHGRAELMHKVIDTRRQLGSSPEQPFNPRNLVELYDWLIRPVENLLPETTGEGDVPHLIIIPSGPLYYLPFQALIWTSEDLTENTPLIARYALSYSPSLATLKYAQALADTAYPQATFLALADPDSGDPRLPDAQTEARAVARLFPHATVYVDSDATEDVVQSASATARDFLLSTHGLFNPHNPMFSYLVVSPTVRNDDGKLHAYEVFTLPLRADMVVLSACETLLPSLEEMTNQLNKIARRAGDNEPKELTDDHLKKLTAGDEVVGLTRAFISAGASSVLSSLWSVPSGSTSQLMISFYNHIAGGMDKAHALRAAQLEVMNAIGCTQPWYWAAFNLMGDWR